MRTGLKQADEPAMRISVIIPTLNEASALPAMLQSLVCEQPFEILVVDGGSSDGTRDAARLADRFLEGPRGRAAQMNHGASRARGDAFLFLHADCRLESGALAAMESALTRPGVAAGCFCQSVDARGLLYRAIDWCATLRVRLSGLVYGDQGLFLSQDVFRQIAGFPEVPFLEDVLISRRLHRLGRIAVVPKRIFISPRRWKRVGIVRQTLRNWGLSALAVAGVQPRTLARFYPAVR
jgi:rSAM/selenodomain-associated transferase 2